MPAVGNTEKKTYIWVVPKFGIATARFSYSLQDLNSSKLGFKLVKIKSLCYKYNNNYFSKLYNLPLIQKKNNNSRGPCLKPLLMIILSSSISHCPYQKAEPVTPGNLETE
jgi:hypothetical protein